MPTSARRSRTTTARCSSSCAPARYVDEAESVEFGEIHLFLVSPLRDRGPPRGGERAQGRAAARRATRTCSDTASARSPGRCSTRSSTITCRSSRGSTTTSRKSSRTSSPAATTRPQRIYFLKREVIEFHRAVVAAAADLEALERGAYPQVDDELRRYFRDVADHARRIDEQVNSQRELLTSILEANLALLSVKQNEVVRAISAWAAIIAVPTFLASIWGMNFEYMPELDERWGYPRALAMMAVAASRFTACSAASSGSERQSSALRYATLDGGHCDRCRRAAAAGRGRGWLRAAGVDPCRVGASRSGLWRQVSFAAGAADPARRRPAAAVDDRRGARRRAHGPAPADRRPRRAAASRSGSPGRCCSRCSPSAAWPGCASLGNPLVALPLWASQPLSLAPLGPVRGRARRARCCTSPSTPASSPSAWRCGCRWSGRCRSPPGSATAPARLRDRRAPARGGARERPDLVGHALYPATRPARRVGDRPARPTRARPAT